MPTLLPSTRSAGSARTCVSGRSRGSSVSAVRDFSVLAGSSRRCAALATSTLPVLRSATTYDAAFIAGGAGTPGGRSTTTPGDANRAPPTTDVAAGGGVGPAPSHLAGEQRALDLLDRPGDLDPARAGLRAVEGRAAAPHTFLVVQDLQSQVGSLVPAVEDEPVRVDNGGGPEVLA